jgi:hypothetical protein
VQALGKKKPDLVSGSGGRGNSLLVVHCLSQGFARFEVGHPFFRDGHTLSRARVATHAGRASVDRKRPKPPQLDAVPAGQSFAHGIEQSLDRELRIPVRQLAKSQRQSFDQVGARHGLLLSNLARSNAPRLVVPAFSREDCWLKDAIASC